MAELFDLLKNVLDDNALSALGERFGLGGEAANEAVDVGLPTLLGGLTNHASQPAGANELLDRVRTTDGGKNLDSILDRLRANDPDPADDSTDFVETILGSGAGNGVLDGLTARLGLGKGAVGGLLGALLPMVLGSLGKLGGLGGLSPSRLLGFLKDGTADAADAAPGGRAGIASLLGPIGAALGLGGAGVGAASAAAAPSGAAASVPESAAAVSQPGAARTDGASDPARPDDRDRRGGFPWWLLAAAVLALGLIVAFAARSCGDDDSVATPPAATTSTETTTTDAPPATADITDATPANFLTARATGADGIVLDGPVIDDATRTALGDAAGVVFGADKVDNQLRVEPGAAGPANEAVDATLAALAKAPRGWTSIWGSADVLTLVGEVASDADKSAIVAAATAAFAPGTVIDKLTVAAASSPEVDAINTEIRLRGVNFVTGSADLTPASRSTLDRIAKILTDAKNVRAQVQGFTDNQGDAGANRALSQRRATSVVAYLVGKGVARNRLVPRGFGEANPIASNSTPAGRLKNRRVVFKRLS
jgi:OmpA-OmpF porin, OOP family